MISLFNPFQSTENRPFKRAIFIADGDFIKKVSNKGSVNQFIIKKITITLIFGLISTFAFSTEYFFSSTNGNNQNSGTSIEKPIKDLSEISDLQLKAGDKIFLKKGDVFYGSIKLSNIVGQLKNAVLLSSYGDGNQKPLIDAKGELNGILIENCSHIKVEDIEITANGGSITNYDVNKNYMRCGVFITTSREGNFTGITLENLYVRDIFFEEKGFNRGTAEILTGNGTQNYGWGIRAISKKPKAVLNDILVSNCLIENVAHSGIRFTGDHALGRKREKNIKKVKIHNNRVLRVGGPGLQVSVGEHVEFKGNHVNYSGSPDDSRKWGRGSGLWVWGCSNVLIEKNSFRNANGPADSAGCHIDFNNNNVIVQYNLSENNDGGFCEILGNNYNCAYRYNVSINDGSREKIEGKTLVAGVMFWLAGFVGFGKTPKGPFNTYFYNNTIYVKDGINPEVAINKATKGVFIANNIFYLEGHASSDKRMQFRPESGPIPNVVFKNNLYLKEDNWPPPSEVMFSDKAPFFGDPQFANKGGSEIEDYTPKNYELIRNKGIDIEMIPMDSIGLMGGLKVKTDILGTKIKGMPDMGAIELD
ncbi:MAG: right-handed parallel beta-helix repeat-containing protein [Cyclobacteriaceae bacterium]